MFIYKMNRLFYDGLSPQTKGSTLKATMQTLVNRGVCLEKSYSSNYYTLRKPFFAAGRKCDAILKEAKTFTINNFARLESLDDILLALANGLKVIFCIGEVLEEREAGKEYDVVKSQIEGSLFNLSAEDFGKIILAYEPVWAIGTGKTATAQQAQEMHAFIRKTVADKYGAEVAENTSILYGGSCKPSNAKELFANKDVDGGLIGGASLDAEQFMGIVDAF